MNSAPEDVGLADSAGPGVPRLVEMFGLGFTAVTLDEAVHLVMRDAASRVRGLVITPNVDHVVLLADDPGLWAIYREARWLFADGMPVVWLSRLCQWPGLPERVTGADLFVRLCTGAARAGLRPFLLGAGPEVAVTAAGILEQANPGLSIAGVYSPPPGFENCPAETDRAVECCNAARPDLLFLGLGTPKQEKWAAANLHRFDTGPILCVGGAFDFVAGHTVRAPHLLQAVGLEWLWRLAHEPRRLWSRYLLRDLRFIPLAVRELVTTSWRGQAGMRGK